MQQSYSPVLTSAAFGVVCLCSMGVLSAGVPQSEESTPAFEVVSVRQNVSVETPSTYVSSPSGSVVITNITLRMLIIEAFGLNMGMAPFTLLGGPEELLSARFDVSAKAPANTSRAQQQLMLRAVLAERFGLRTHKEAREVPTYALAIARQDNAGVRIGRADKSCSDYMAAARKAGVNPFTDANTPRDASGKPLCIRNIDFSQPGAISVRFLGGPVEFARQIQGFVDRPITDATGLVGNFEWVLTFAQSPTPRSTNTAPSLFVALEEQLGLKLQPRNSSMEVMVIDSVQMPTAN